MNRRAILQLAVVAFAAPRTAFAQPKKVYRLGWLSTSDEARTKLALDDAFLVGLRELGYAVGRNLVVDVRYARGDMTRLPALADELIALKPDVLLGLETACSVLAKKTSTIPIVVISSPDLVAAGLAPRSTFASMSAARRTSSSRFVP